VQSEESIDWTAALMPQLLDLRNENAKLLSICRDQERELQHLRSSPHDSFRPRSSNASSSVPQDMKDGKIVELAKKNRSLNVALEKERAKSGRMATELKRVQEELEEVKKSGGGRDMAGMDARSLPAGANKDGGGGKPTLAFGSKWEEPKEDGADQSPEQKIKELNSKVSSLTTQVGTMRHQNDKLKMELNKTREALKKELGDIPLEKVLEDGSTWTGRAQTISLLQSKIVQLKRELSNISVSSARGEGKGGALDYDGFEDKDVAMRVDDQHRKEIERIERDRKREAQQLQDDLLKEREEKEGMRKKLDAASARVRNLEKDCRDLRDKIQILIAKTDNDDNLIAALQSEMEAMARKTKDERRKARGEESGALEELQEVRRQLKDKENQVDRQQKIIISLRAELQSAMTKTEEATSGAMKAEMSMLAEENFSQKLRIAEVKHEKLSEFADLLKKRLEEAEEKLRLANGSLRQERQRCVEVERKLESKSSASSRRAHSAPGQFPPEKVQQLVDRLNSTTEEMDALQESFQRTLEIKEKELRTCKELLREQQKEIEVNQAEMQRRIMELQEAIFR